MTSEEMNAILSEFGFNADSEFPMPLDNVSEIILASDENIYPDDNTGFIFEKMKGNKKCSFMSVYVKKPGEIWSSIENENITPRTIVHYSNIIGFHMTGPNKRREPFRYGISV